MYYDTDDGLMYYWNGTTWVAPGTTATIYDSDQVGTIKSFSGTVIPNNWMLAAGQSLERLLYPQLWAALGSAAKYGAVDGTHFNLPNLTNKFLYGATSLAAMSDAAIGGEATVNLAETHMPRHRHGGTTNTLGHSMDHLHPMNHDHTLQMANIASSGSFGTGQPAGTSGGAVFDSGGGGAGSPIKMLNANTANLDRSLDHSHGFNTAWKGGDGTQSDGAGTGHNNLPPYILVAFIIKVTGAEINAGGALVGAPGPQGNQGPIGPAGADGPEGADGSLEVYEQPAEPSTTELGAVWIDTDATPFDLEETIPDRIGEIAKLITDWNLAIENGWYMGSGATNGPVAATWFLGQVTVHNALYIQQEVWDFAEAQPHAAIVG